METEPTFTAFLNAARLVTAPLPEVLTLLWRHQDAADHTLPFLIFNDATGAGVDFDLRGSLAQVLTQLPSPAPANQRPGPQRESREVALLVRHWAWLDAQPGGAAVTLRRLVDAARKAGVGRERQAQDATSRFLGAVAGDHRGFQDVLRTLYAGNRSGFEDVLMASGWPEDVVSHALHLAAEAFGSASAGAGETAES